MSTFQIVRQFSTSKVAQKMVMPPIQVFGVDGRYATALYSAAHKSKQLDAVDKDVKTLESTLKKDKRFREFVLDPTFKRPLKSQAFQQALTKINCCDLTKNMFAALGDNGRLKLTTKVLSKFSQIMSVHNGEVDCVVTTAKTLDAAAQKELTAALQAFLKPNEKLQLTMKVDPTIIGGMRVSIGDRYVDMSMATKIRKYDDIIHAAI